MQIGPVEDRSNSVRSPSCISGLSLIAFDKPDFHITGRGAGQRRGRQLRRSLLANAIPG
jgi:hypothetical protein